MVNVLTTQLLKLLYMHLSADSQNKMNAKTINQYMYSVSCKILWKGENDFTTNLCICMYMYGIFFLKNPLTAIAVDIPFGFYTLLTHVVNLLDRSL